MPARVGARPRDDRGYPVPAITPWADGKPAFANLGSWRTYICLAERRCSVCGTKMPPGPVYRPVDDESTALARLAVETGVPVMNAAPASEPAGHRSCMLYAAVVCPHLTSSGSRRKQAAKTGGEIIPKGDARGAECGVVGYESYSFELTSQGLEIHYGQPVELIAYGEGAELLGELAKEIASELAPPSRCPDYLMEDEDKAEAAAKRLIATGSSSTMSLKARQQEQARKTQRKAAKIARRKNR
jgi:hypothetical protein